MASTLESLIRVDYARSARQIRSFISRYVSDPGVVIGLSGGLDSTVVLRLAADALGPERVYGLILRAESTPAQDVRDAISFAHDLQVRYRLVNIAPIISRFLRSLPAGSKKSRGNLAARVRMAALYHEASIRNYLVCGTSDRSELLIGYFTKYGDGASDLMPLATLYKTQVRELGRHLKLPDSIIGKKSSPRLWRGHLAETELGTTYEVIDQVLYLLEKNMTVSQISSTSKQSKNTVSRIKSMVDSSAHKRVAAPAPDL